MEEYKRWLRQAEEDLNWAKQSINSSIYYGACFASQQAAEKALKGFLLKKKRPLRKIHDLVAVLEDCLAIDSAFEELRDYVKVLFPYYIETRYPDLGGFAGFDDTKAQEAYDSANKVIGFVKSKV